MSDQRPAFRFRLPWLMPSAPAPSQPTTTTDIQIPAQPTTTTPVVRPPFRPAGVAPPPPPSQVQTPPRIGPQSSSASQVGARTRDPSQPSSPARAAAQARVASLPPPPPPPPPQVQAPPRRTESQPSSPSRFGSQTRIASQPTSPARAAAEARSAASQPPPSPVQEPPSTEFKPSSPSGVGSQLSSPARATAQVRAASQPRPPSPPPPPPPQVQESPSRAESQPASSPSRVGAQTRRISSPQASPARLGTQSRAASQPPPPPQVKEPARTQSQPNSPSRFGAQTQVPSQLSSPAKAATQAAQARATSQPQSPVRVVPPPQAASKPSSPARSTPRAASQAASPSRSVPQPRVGSPPSPPSRTTPLQAEPVAQSPSPPKTLQSTTQQPLSPPLVSRKEPSNPMVAQLQAPRVQPVKDIDGNLRETKDEKELEKASFEPKKNSVIELLTEASSRLKAKTKELPTFAFQENHVENQESLETKETVPTSSFSEKQVKPAFSHPKDRSPVIESRQKPAVSSVQRVPLQKEIRDDISKLVNKMSIGHTKDNNDKKPLSVITIAGDNRGATMILGSDSSSKRERTVHIHRAYKLNPDESIESTTDGEGSSKGQKRPKDKEEETKKSYINNNSQGINNSIVFNSSITEHNPGVHLVISHNPKEPNKLNDRIESLSRAEMNFTPSQKLTYEPTIRRRCLRGLLMEPSDSDSDNPEKPRRHGCPYARGEKSKDDNNIDVL